jgi:hypothetical protein
MLDLFGFNTLKIIGGGACLIGLLLGTRDGEAAVVAACCAALASIFAADLKRLGTNAPR